MESITNKSLDVLKVVLQEKILKLCQPVDTSNLTGATIESNLSEKDDELNKDDEELLIFSEVLKLLKIPMPQVLQSKLQIVLELEKIPVRQIKTADTEEEKRNTFLVYTNNKKLSEIGEKLTAEEVYAIKEFALQQKNDEIVEALSVIDHPKSLETIPGFKDLVYYYVILNLFKHSLQDRIYTHFLENLLEGARDSLPEPEKRVHIQDALNQLRRYPLTAHPPGICIIFAMLTDRPGAEKDLQKVRKFFETDLNYDVKDFVNPEVKKIKNVVAELSAQKNKFYDSLVVWFMAHGDETFLYVKDDKKIHRRIDLLQPFVDIAWLKNKPKLFFIQACAVKIELPLLQSGTVGLTAETDNLSHGMGASEEWKDLYKRFINLQVTNSMANTLVSYATMWYQPASRTADGSLFINTLQDCLKLKGRMSSIESVLRLVHYRVNMVCLDDGNTLWKQAPYYESSLKKKFIFP